MKWQGRKDTFSDGELRTRKKFAITPVKLINYEWVWLDYYFIDEQFFIPIAHGLVGMFPHFIVLKKYQVNKTQRQIELDKISDVFSRICLIIGFMIGIVGVVMCIMHLLK